MYFKHIFKILWILGIGLLSIKSIAEPIRIATWNVHNYLICDRWIEGHYRPQYPKPESEKQALRKIIHKVKPDILAIQEMGSLAFLKELQQDLAKEGSKYPYYSIVEGNDPERKLAILSKKPFKSITPHAKMGFYFNGSRHTLKRGLLEVQFETAKGVWSLYVIHLRSRYTTNQEDPNAGGERQAEAYCIRDFIKKNAHSKTKGRYLITGDFNSTLTDSALKTLTKAGKKVITRIIPTMDSHSEAWTYRYNKEGSYYRLDYMLASPAFYSHILGNRGFIEDCIPESLKASDHRMVYVDVDI